MYIFSEGGGTQEVLIVADRLSEQTFDLDVSITSGGVAGIPKADENVDFSATVGLLTLPPLSTSTAVEVALTNDSNAEIVEGFQLQLAQGPQSPSFILGNNTNADVLILDSNGELLTQLQFLQ